MLIYLAGQGLTLSILGKHFAVDDILKYFSYFFPESKLLHSMKIVSLPIKGAENMERHCMACTWC